MRFARSSSSKVVSGVWSSSFFPPSPGMVWGDLLEGEIVCPDATPTPKQINAARVQAVHETLFIRLSEFTLTIGTPTPKLKLQKRRELGDYGMRPGLSGELINSPGLPLRLTMIVLGSIRSGVRFLPCAEVYATNDDCGSAFKPARRIEANSSADTFSAQDRSCSGCNGFGV